MGRNDGYRHMRASSESDNDLDSHSKKKLSCCQRFREFIFPDDCYEEVKAIFSIAWAIILTSFLQFFMQSISIIMCGHLSTIELDSVALANTLVNVLGVNIIGGMSTAFDTFFSQTYGSGNKKGVGIYLQRALILSYLVLLCLYCVHINIEPILIGLGQDKLTALMASQYILLILPGLFFDFNFQTLAKYLQNQDRVVAPLLCALAGNVVNAVSQYLCLFVFHFSYHASAICQSASFGLMFLLELSYILISGLYKETWDGWKLREMMNGWGEFMRIAIPGILLIAFEAWCFEIGIIVSGLIDTVQMGIQAVIFQFEAWSFMLPFGLSIAVSIRVGQNLGSMNPKGAAVTYRVALFISLTISTVVAVLVLLLRFELPKIFSKDASVIAGSGQVLILFVFFNYFVGIAHVTSGALRGCGRQIIAAIMVFLGYYLIGLPVGISLTLLTDLMVVGFWIGLTLATLTESIGFSFYLNCFLDWHAEAKKSQEIAFSDSLGEISNNENDDNNSTKKKLISSDSDKTPSKYNTLVDSSSDEEHDFRLLLCCRVIVVGIVLALVTGAVLIHFLIPKTWRLTCIPVNSETVKINYRPYAFCSNGTAISNTTATS